MSKIVNFVKNVGFFKTKNLNFCSIFFKFTGGKVFGFIFLPRRKFILFLSKSQKSDDPKPKEVLIAWK